MGWMTAAAIVGSSLIGADASSNAANTQANAASAATDAQIAAQERMFNRQVDLQAPWRQAGETALNALTPLALNYKKFGMSDFQADPGYAFRLSEGQKALDRSAAARGGLISGSALKAATRYGQDMGSQEYTNAFNRYQTERAAQLQPLQSLAGVGQTSANTLSNAAGNAGAAESAALGAGITNAANARASGYVGGANALSSGLSTYLNYNQNQNMMNMLNQNNIMSGLQTPEGIANYFKG